MNRGPLSGQSSADHLTKAIRAWGGEAPDWIVVLAEACMRTNQKAVAEQIGYSPATISQLLSNSYRGDVSRLEIIIRGALMGETVPCPILGALPRNTCLDWQKKPWAATSSHRVRMYQACRAGCPNSRIMPTKVEVDDAL